MFEILGMCRIHSIHEPHTTDMYVVCSLITSRFFVRSALNFAHLVYRTLLSRQLGEIPGGLETLGVKFL